MANKVILYIQSDDKEQALLVESGSVNINYEITQCTGKYGEVLYERSGKCDILMSDVKYKVLTKKDLIKEIVDE